MINRIMNWLLGNKEYIPDKEKYTSNTIEAEKKNKYTNWRAEIGGKYWTFDDDLRVFEYVDDYTWFDDYRHHMRMYFKTEEETYEGAKKKWGTIRKWIIEDLNSNKLKKNFPWYETWLP